MCHPRQLWRLLGDAVQAVLAVVDVRLQCIEGDEEDEESVEEGVGWERVERRPGGV